jgi:Cof subfamily protein (haloacid dehalogenase superfamily)
MPQTVPGWQTDVSELEAFSRIRLMAVDLDGSFVRPTARSVYPSLRDLHRSFAYGKYRIAVTVATGRAWGGAKPLVEDLSISKGMPIILYNGALVLENVTLGIIARRTIPRAAVDAIAGLCNPVPVKLYAYFFNDPFTAAAHSVFVEHVFALGKDVPELDINGLQVAPWCDLPDKLTNCTAMLVEVRKGPKFDRLRLQLESIEEISCTKSSGQYIEIRPRGVNKGEALRDVARHLNISLDRTLTLGDNDNDAEMLALAGIGVSVMGASRIALESSRYVCRHGAAEGAVEIMRLLKHAKRFFGSPIQKARMK